MAGLLAVASVVLAMLTGVFIWIAISCWQRQDHYKKYLLGDIIGVSPDASTSLDGESGLVGRIVGMMRVESRKESVHSTTGSVGAIGSGIGRESKVVMGRDFAIEHGVERIGDNKAIEEMDKGADGEVVGKMGRKKRLDSSVARSMFKSRWFCTNVSKSGLGDQITELGFCRTRFRLAFLIGASLSLLGAIFSTEMCLILLVGGIALGWRMPKRALAQRIENRTNQMEHHLPEMLDVIALGMRSGLSFDSSLKLYTSHFRTYLAQEFSNIQRQWLSGLERRDDALRKIADSYDSQIFKRIVETIIRSIRFGSSMVESLEEQSAEARVAYRTRREEQVAKAPVKMMIPTGTLILPAMLIMVVGPILLELMGGGL